MDLFGASADLLSGIGGFVGAQSQASGLKAEANAYGVAAQYSGLETDIKEQMASRQIYQTIGAGKAATGASGLALGGSAADVMRSSAQQGALTKSLLQAQGNVEVSSYLARQQSASAAATAAQAKGDSGLLGGILKGVGAIASIFSDDALKEDVELLVRRSDGLGIYKFRFKESNQFYRGALASEVEAIYPDAVMRDHFGTRMVDYGAIGIEFAKLERAA